MPALTEQLERERLLELAELGFTPDQARELATARTSQGFLVSIHDVREAIARGCPLELAHRIYR